jgi:hypothetical protein
MIFSIRSGPAGMTLWSAIRDERYRQKRKGADPDSLHSMRGLPVRRSQPLMQLKA